ncbi:hypothetical protein CFRA_02640 [Corynebacterium frankenforstense DSM 45800]|uniref:Uncharacterized protein n=2 Tax=Corynebacterium TaxID=1716 RepID=A0A1L7CR72_9CORY|nr:hypothetical protein CFRA_02640 [Corynebacterium frankenforstense DSM 45800]
MIATLACASLLLAGCGDDKEAKQERRIQEQEASISSMQSEAAEASASASREAEAASESRASESSRAAASRSLEADIESREREASRSRAAASESASRSQQYEEPQQEPAQQEAAADWPSPPGPPAQGFEWHPFGPYGTGTASNCIQVSEQWPAAYSECFRMPDGWYFYGQRQAL